MATLGSLIADDTVWNILGHSHLAGDKADELSEGSRDQIEQVAVAEGPIVHASGRATHSTGRQVAGVTKPRIK
jgi:hypothetical protein